MNDFWNNLIAEHLTMAVSVNMFYIVIDNKNKANVKVNITAENFRGFDTNLLNQV